MNKDVRGLFLIVSSLILVVISPNFSDRLLDRNNSVQALGEHQSGSCTNNSRYVADVTIPDGTKVDPGKTFVKTWRIRNSGTCTWTTDYSIVYVNGDRIGAPASVKLRERVTPGNNVDISVTFTAPSAAGTYVSSWQLQAPNGVKFGIKPYVGVVVVDPLALLKGEIYLGGLGGDNPYCSTFDRNTASFGFSRNWIGLEMSEFRFRGIPFEDSIQIKLTDPNGTVYSRTMQLTDVYDSDCGEFLEAYEYENSPADPWVIGLNNGRETILSVHSWIPVGSLHGKWKISVITSQKQVQHEITIGNPSEPVMSTMPANRSYSPFTSAYAPFGRCNTVIKAGEKVKVVGEGFPKNKTFPIGIYQNDGSLVTGFTVQSDNMGRFSINYTTNTRLKTGEYAFVVPATAFTPPLDQDLGFGDLCLEIL